MHTIQTLTATEILDSRGTPTIEVTCVLTNGATAVASVPSGASTGVHEALELRDGDHTRYGGKGVMRAVGHVTTEIATHVIGTAYDQAGLDAALIALDGTLTKSRLGANALLGVSMAFARAAATAEGVPLYEYFARISDSRSGKPQPMFNVINGGKHADSGLSIQEFMIVPVGFDTTRRKVQAGAEVIISLQHILHTKGYSTSVGDEGGFAPTLTSDEEACELLVEAIAAAGYATEEIKIALDVAASSFYSEGRYHLRTATGVQQKTTAEMIAWYTTLVEKYPIISIEDGLAEDDWGGFRALHEALGSTTMIVGDDLTVTNVVRITQALAERAINAVLIKLNQIGTVSETIAAIKLTQNHGWTPIVSHRSGETTDTFIADMAVGLGCSHIKSGSLVRGERVCKYNRLMNIEEEIA